MIEPTDEMLAAFQAAWDDENRVINDSPGEYFESGARDRAGLAAVLAIVERDYRLYPLCTETLAGLRCERSAGISHPRQGGRIEHMTHAPGGAVVTWS